MRYPFILFDWGDSIMRDSPNQTTPMYQWPTVELIDGAAEVLRALHSHRTICLATGAALSDESDIRRALDRVNVSSFFDKIYCFKNTGHKKPSAEFYLYILRDLRAVPSDVLMAGDSFENDVMAPKRVGISALWLNPNNAENKNGDLHGTIHFLRELVLFLNLPDDQPLGV